MRGLRVQLVQLFTQYFTKVKEKYIRENFVLIYELLDEVCDNGVPQITEPSVLKEYIFQKGTFLRERKESARDVTLQVTGAVAHRNPRVAYKKNEVYLDIVETTHVLMSVDGAPRMPRKHGRLTPGHGARLSPRRRMAMDARSRKLAAVAGVMGGRCQACAMPPDLE